MSSRRKASPIATLDRKADQSVMADDGEPDSPSRSPVSAGSLASRITVLDATVTCPICQETLTSPKSLPCLHHACQSCLQKHINQHVKVDRKTGYYPESFPCPVCLEMASPPTDQGRPDQWAATFPSNFFLGLYGMVAAAQRDVTECGPCTRRGEKSVAKWWCGECATFQCNVCSTTHEGFQAFEGHTVLSIRDLKQHPGKAVPSYEPCARHKEKISLFCKDHQASCCAVCVAKGHRKCESIVSVADAASDLKESGELNRLIKILRDYEDVSNEIAEQRAKVANELDDKKQDIILQMRDARVRVEDELQRLEEKLVREFSEFHQRQMDKITELQRNCENLTKQISNAIQLLDAVQQNGCDSQIVTLVGKVSKQVEKYEDVLRQKQRTVATVDYEFDMDTSIDDILKRSFNLGVVTVVNSGVKAYQIRPSAQLTSVSPDDRRRLTAREVTRFNVRVAGDNRRCGIVGGLYLNDDKILLADFDNFRVKLFSDKGVLLSQVPLKSKPSDITKINSETFAVTLPSAKKMQYVLLSGDALSAGRILKMSRSFHGVSCHGNHLYLTSGSGVSVCDTEGEELFSPVQDQRNRFLSPGYVKATPNGLYVTDYQQNSVTALNFEGEVVSSHTAKDFRYPLGLDTDNQGNVYVCCKTASVVHQLADDVTHLKAFLVKEQVTNPLTIAFQRTRDRFFISESKAEDKDYIRIFELI